MLKWKSVEITNLLLHSTPEETHTSSSTNELENEDQQDNHPSSSKYSIVKLGDIAFAVFLEPPEETDPNMTFGERIVDQFIQAFSQKPTMVHTEVVIPPFLDRSTSKIHFATYLGSHASFQNEYDAVSGVDFYLIRHGRRWRCLPVFGTDAVNSIRDSCSRNVGSPYSLAMYPTSSHYFRNWSWIWSDKPKHKGHCATLTSRVLQQAGIKCGLKHPSPWYSPSSLYSEIHEHLKTSLDSTEIEDLRAADKEECQKSIEIILRGPLSVKAMLDLGHEKCVDAIRELTYRVVKATQDGAPLRERQHAERELGDCVFKWCLLGREL